MVICEIISSMFQLLFGYAFVIIMLSPRENGTIGLVFISAAQFYILTRSDGIEPPFASHCIVTMCFDRGVMSYNP